VTVAIDGEEVALPDDIADVIFVERADEETTADGVA
jgi:hypothetical protein